MIKHSLRKCIRFLVPAYRMRDKIMSIAADLSSETLAIDVGASYFPHVHWAAVRQSPNACWIAVDPNAHNLQYLRNWDDFYRSKLLIIPNGLSDHDGSHTLYVTNVDSGSSLLEPIVNEDWQHRVDPGYFFPLRPTSVDCLSLNTVLRDFAEDFGTAPIWLKLDTQGSESSILEGLSKEIYQNNVLVVESECTLQRIPIMKSAGKFDRLASFLEPLGFELVSLDPIYIPTSPKISRIRGARGILNECDAVFMLSPSFAINNRSLTHNLSLVSAYLSYTLYQEAFHHALLVLDQFSGELNASNSSALHKLLKVLS